MYTVENRLQENSPHQEGAVLQTFHGPGAAPGLAGQAFTHPGQQALQSRPEARYIEVIDALYVA